MTNTCNDQSEIIVIDDSDSDDSMQNFYDSSETMSVDHSPQPQYAHLVQTAYANQIIGRSIHIIDNGKCCFARIIAFFSDSGCHRIVHTRTYLFEVDDVNLMQYMDRWHFASDPVQVVRTFAPNTAAAMIGQIIIIFQDINNGTGFIGVVLE